VSLAPPRYWGDLYVAIVKRTLKYGAWITCVTNFREWIIYRRKLIISVTQKEKSIKIKLVQLEDTESLPMMRLRIHRDINKIKNTTGDISTGDNYFDIICNKSNVVVMVK